MLIYITIHIFIHNYYSDSFCFVWVYQTNEDQGFGASAEALVRFAKRPSQRTPQKDLRKGLSEHLRKDLRKDLRIQLRYCDLLSIVPIYCSFDIYDPLRVTPNN